MNGVDISAAGSVRSRARTALVGLIAIILAMGASIALASQSEAAGACRFIAHRGGAWPGLTENGLGSIKRSYAAGVRQFEVDVRTSASGTPWIMHDPTVQRTVSNATGYVADKTDDQMRAMRLLDGEPVPNLTEVLAYAASHDMAPVLHVKAMTNASWAILFRQIRAKKLQSRVVILGSAALLSYSKSVAPSLFTVLLDESRTISPDRVTAFDGAAVRASVVTQENVDAIHAAGKVYWSFDGEASSEWPRLGSLGVDVQITNDVAGYQEYQAAGCPI